MNEPFYDDTILKLVKLHVMVKQFQLLDIDPSEGINALQKDLKKLLVAFDAFDTEYRNGQFLDDILEEYGFCNPESFSEFYSKEKAHLKLEALKSIVSILNIQEEADDMKNKLQSHKSIE